MMNESAVVSFVGQSFVFDDGNSIKIIQVKRRENGPWVTYEIVQGANALPRRLVMEESEFIKNFGHLFF